MLSGATFKAAAIAGTAVFKIVVSSDSMKNATATSHGNNRLLDACRGTTVAKSVFSQLLHRYVQHHQPILNRLQRETDKDETQSERAHHPLRKVVREIFDERYQRGP